MTKIQKLQEALRTLDVDCALISSELNQRYLSGFNYSDGYIIVTLDKAYLLADFRYIEAARAAVGDEFEVLMPEGGALKEAGKLHTPLGEQEPTLEELKERIDIGDFKVLFRYNLFMPCSYNIFTDKPADSWTGMSFTSPMYRLSKTEMLLGYDYIFVNGVETTLNISVEVYDKDNQYVIKEGAYGLANVAPTIVKMMGLTAPECWEASMV